jgi:hypothetical protein
MRPAFVVGIVALAAVLAIGAIALAGSRSTRPGASPSTSDRQLVLAPIDDVQVLIRQSTPPRATLTLTAGLPSGCAREDSWDVKQVATEIFVTVRNSMPTGNPVCTAIYGTYVLTIDVDLGSDFAPGTTGTVHVNDKTTTFKV